MTGLRFSVSNFKKTSKKHRTSPGSLGTAKERQLATHAEIFRDIFFAFTQRHLQNG